MRDRETPERFVQITGAPEDIDQLLGHWIMDGARRCDLHGQAWIEMVSITDRQREVAAMSGCTVHLIQSSPYSSVGWREKPSMAA